MPRNEQQLQELKTQIVRFRKVEKERIIKRQEWGVITLEDARSDIERIYSIIDYLSVLPIEPLPVDAINPISASIKGINDLLEQIDKFSIDSSGNPSQQKNSFITNIQSQADSLYKNASQWIPFLAYQKGDVAENIEALTSAVKKAETISDQAATHIQSKEREIEDIIAKAREAAASAGAAIFTSDFRNESVRLKDNAVAWLWVTGILSILTVLAAGAFWYFSKAGLDAGLIWQQVSTKVVLLGVLVTATVWCGKIYRALMHQAAIYQHRALSIQTLQAFVAAVKEPEIKDTVVLEAARAIFGTASTGYIDAAKDQSDGTVKILEIAKNIMPKNS